MTILGKICHYRRNKRLIKLQNLEPGQMIIIQYNECKEPATIYTNGFPIFCVKLSYNPDMLLVISHTDILKIL